ncbi:MAG: hypothetical protein ACE14P_15410 [Methanotrichaceae archaeon]
MPRPSAWNSDVFWRSSLALILSTLESPYGLLRVQSLAIPETYLGTYFQDGCIYALVDVLHFQRKQACSRKQGISRKASFIIYLYLAVYCNGSAEGRIP